WPARRPAAPRGAEASASALHTADENKGSCLSGVRPSRSGPLQVAPFQELHRCRVLAARRSRIPAALRLAEARQTPFGRAFSVTRPPQDSRGHKSLFNGSLLIATLCPTGQRL